MYKLSFPVARKAGSVRHHYFTEVFDTYLTTGNPIVGKAFHIRDTIKGRYYYPREPGMSSTDLRMQEKCNTLRPLPCPCLQQCRPFAPVHGLPHFDLGTDIYDVDSRRSRGDIEYVKASEAR